MERTARRAETPGPQENIAQQLLIGLGQVTLMFGQDSRVKALPGAWPLQRHRGGPDSESALGGITVGAVLRVLLQVKVPFAFEGTLEHVSQAGLE